MKKISRLLALCAIGTSVFFTSCVSEDVSPQVEELRSAQADYLQAQAAFQQAKAATETAQAALLQTQAQVMQAESDARIAMMEAQTRVAEAQAAYEEALMEARQASEIAQLEAEVAEAQYQKDLLEAKLEAEKAEMDARIAQAKVEAAQAQLALQEAVDALAGQINETAKEYLNLYQNTTEQANNKLEQITALREIVTRYEANLDVDGNVLDFDRVAADLQSQISTDLATIDAIEANISRLEALNANAAGVREELNDVQERIDELEASLNDANLEADRAWLDVAPFSENYTELNNTINEIESRQSAIALYENYIPQVESEIEKVEERLAPYKTDLESVQDQLISEMEVLEEYLATVEDTWYSLEYARLNGTPEEIQAANDAYNEALTAVTDYTGTFIGNSAHATDYLNSYIYYPVAGAPFGDAVLEVRDIENYATYQDLVDEWSNLNSLLASTQNSLMLTQNALAYYQEVQNNILASVGVDSVDDYFTTWNAVSEDYYEKRTAANEIQAQIDAQWQLEGYLYWYLNDPNRSVADFDNQINDLENQKASLEADVQYNQDLLAQNAFEAEEMAAMIQRTQDKIESLMTEYDALVALANEYLEKFNEILENN